MSPTLSQHTRMKMQMAEKIRAKRREICEWYMAKSQLAPPPFYCSIDLRDSGHKIVPVDSNLYPAGFNNICPEDMRAAPPVLRAHLEAEFSRLGLSIPKRILVLPESHTSNTYYIENLHYLTQIIVDAGFECRVGWFSPLPEGTTSPLTLLSQTQKEVPAHAIEIGADGTLSAGGFVPDLVVLNNDFSSGYPEALDRVRQPILPSHRMGWHSRKKSTHFTHYNRLAAEFAAITGIDPWSIQIDTEEVAPVNFNEDQGIDQVADAVERVLARTRTAYERLGIKRRPFVFVKNNHGTYGMGIMVVHSADEVRTMNRRSKNKMSVGKNKLVIDSVAVQEGVPTATIVDRLAAEPVIYLFGGQLIGGFLRTNTEKGDEENLNAQGMVFRKLCMSDLAEPIGLPFGEPDEADAADLEDELKKVETGGPHEALLELVYGSVARISALATGLEMKA